MNMNMNMNTDIDVDKMMRRLYDPLYGLIEITPLMQQFIYTNEFQRLRYLKQLGATSYIFPSGTHTRFEHSIGVSHLAGEMMKHIQLNQPELSITNRMIEIVRIAGLLHDIGHGVFSHLYDDYIIDIGDKKHEERGKDIIQDMVEKYSIDITNEELNDCLEMIDPSEGYKYNWLYQIVANKLNTIDVDKLDYIRRDVYHLGLSFSGNFDRLFKYCRVVWWDKYQVLAWDNKLIFDIYSLFHTRYRLHRQVLTHHRVKGIEYDIIDILKYMKSVKGNMMDEMDDTILNSEDRYVKYKMSKIHTSSSWKCKEEYCIEYSGIEIDEILKKCKIFEKDYIIDYVDVGYSHTKTNPIYEVIYYNQDDIDIGYKITKEDNKMVGMIIPKDSYREIIVRMYMKNVDLKYMKNDRKRNIYEKWNNCIKALEEYKNKIE